MRPWDIARLTDFQIERLYRRPIAKRNAELRSRYPSSGGHAGADEPAGDASAGIKDTIARGEAPNRSQMVLLFTMMGVDKKTANAMYDEQLAQWNEMRAKKGA